MARKTINKLTSNKWFLIAVSCLISIFLWVYVNSVENVDIENTITGIPVTYLGEEDILADRKLIVTDKADQTVTLRLYGKRSDISSIKKSDIQVTVDLTDVKNTGEIERVYDVALTNGVDINDIFIDKTPTYVTVNIDRMSTTKVEIRGEINVTVAEGYMAEPAEYDREYIEISGPGELISKVDHAFVRVERENLNKTVTNSVDYKLIDAEGNEVVSDEIEVDVDQVEVTIPVVMYKEVVLDVDIIPGGGAKKTDAVVEIEPRTIALSGDAGILSSLNKISIGSVDLSDFAISHTATFTIPVSNELNNLSGITEAEVKVSVKNLATKRLLVSNIEFDNVSEGYTATSVTQYLEVMIRGPQEIIDLVNAYNVRIVADLADLGSAVGRYAVDAKVIVDGYSDAGGVGDYSVVVSLEESIPEEQMEE